MQNLRWMLSTEKNMSVFNDISESQENKLEYSKSIKMQRIYPQSSQCKNWGESWAQRRTWASSTISLYHKIGNWGIEISINMQRIHQQSSQCKTCGECWAQRRTFASSTLSLNHKRANRGIQIQSVCKEYISWVANAKTAVKVEHREEHLRLQRYL